MFEQTKLENEAELVRATQRGDTNAFASLIDLHLDQLRAFIALKLPAPHLVNEIAHETFVFAFRNISQFHAGTSLRAWFRAIAANLIRAEIQRFRREETNQLGFARYQLVEREINSSTWADGTEIEHLHGCLEELPPPMKELIALRYERDLPIEVISRKLDRTETSIWQALFRLRKQLKLCIEGKLGRTYP